VGNRFRLDRNHIRITLRYGRDRKKTVRQTCQWPRGASVTAIELLPATLLLKGEKDILTGLIQSAEEIYLRSLTMSLRLREVPGERLCVSGPPGPFLALSERNSGETIMFARKQPVRQIISYRYDPAGKKIRIRWDFNCLLPVEAEKNLDGVYIRTGARDSLRSRYSRGILKHNTQLPEKTPLSGWMTPADPGRGYPLKKLEETLTLLEREKIWFNLICLDELHPVPGDWLNVRKDYQGKLGSLTRRIEHNRMIPGLRFSPLAVSPDSDLFRTRQDWLLRDFRGEPLTLNGRKRKPGSCFLDFTRDDVKEYLRGILETFRNQWGFRAFHLKGLEVLTAGYRREEMEQEGGLLLSAALRFFRENIGRDDLLVAEGGSLLASAGTVNIHRDSRRQPQSPGESIRYFRKALPGILDHSLMQKTFWIYDPGCYPAGSAAEEWPMQIRESLRQVILLTGGHLSVRDELTGYSKEQISELRRTLESFGKFRTGMLTLLSCPDAIRPVLLYNSAGYLGVFNLSRRKKSISLDLKSLEEQLGIRKTASLMREGRTGLRTGTLDLILPPYGSRIFEF